VRPMNEDPGKKLADKVTKATYEAFEKGTSAAEEAGQEIEQSYSAAAAGIRHFNLRLMEMVHANSQANFDFAREISTAKGPSEAVALWSSHTQKQFGMLTEQFKELAALGQRIASSSAEPITRSLRGFSSH
jgi:phasin